MFYFDQTETEPQKNKGFYISALIENSLIYSSFAPEEEKSKLEVTISEASISVSGKKKVF